MYPWSSKRLRKRVYSRRTFGCFAWWNTDMAARISHSPCIQTTYLRVVFHQQKCLRTAYTFRCCRIPYLCRFIFRLRMCLCIWISGFCYILYLRHVVIRLGIVRCIEINYTNRIPPLLPMRQCLLPNPLCIVFRDSIDHRRILKCRRKIFFLFRDDHRQGRILRISIIQFRNRILFHDHWHPIPLSSPRHTYNPCSRCLHR